MHISIKKKFYYINEIYNNFIINIIPFYFNFISFLGTFHIYNKKKFCLLNIRNSSNIKNAYYWSKNMISLYENDYIEVVNLSNYA